MMANWLEAITCSDGGMTVCTAKASDNKLAPDVTQVNGDQEPKCRGMSASQYLLYRSSCMSREGEEAPATIRM